MIFGLTVYGYSTGYGESYQNNEVSYSTGNNPYGSNGYKQVQSNGYENKPVKGYENKPVEGYGGNDNNGYQYSAPPPQTGYYRTTTYNKPSYGYSGYSRYSGYNRNSYQSGTPVTPVPSNGEVAPPANENPFPNPPTPTQDDDPEETDAPEESETNAEGSKGSGKPISSGFALTVTSGAFILFANAL